MGRWVALLRGVNVGGANKVPMAGLRALAEGLGWGRVETLIASGNLVFDAEGAGLAEALRGEMRARMGVDVGVLVIAGGDFAARVVGCPFDPVAGKDVHGFFLFGPGQVDEAEVARWKAGSEEVRTVGDVVWLHAPEGVGRSKLAARMDRVVRGVDMTARNLNTLRTLAGMAGE